jgi:cell division protein FtsB
VRAEILERFERVDRRLAQQEQRLERIHQRAADAVDRVEALSDELLARIDALTATNAPRQSSARPDAIPARAPRGPS